MTDAATSSAALDGGAAATTDTTAATVNAAADAAQGKAPAGSPTIAWLEGASAEQVGYVQNKGWTDPKQLLDGYQNLEKLRGVPADRLLTLPAADADEATRGAFFDKLGRPADAKSYDFSLGENDGGWTDRLKGSFHKHGVSAEAAKGIISDYAAGVELDKQAQAQEAREKFQADTQALRTEWGAAHDQNTQIARQGRDALGWTSEVVDAVGAAIGHANLMKMLHNVGSRTGEASFVASGQQPALSGAMSPDQAQARLNELTADKDWVGRLMKGGTESKEAQERRRLIGFIHGGKS